jgi:hypothetical protein
MGNRFQIGDKLKASEFEMQIQEFVFRLLPFINQFYKKNYTENDAIIDFNRQELINDIEILNALKDQKEISDFMIYCDFSDDFLAKSSSYDIVVQIQRCYKEFNSIE